MPRPHPLAALAAALILALPARADVPEAIARHILPGTAAFAAATAELADRAQADCTPATVAPAFHAAFDAWMQISHLRIGPMEEDGRAPCHRVLARPKGLGREIGGGLLDKADPAVLEPQAFADQSVAARGLFALERLLYDPDMMARGDADYRCALTRAIATDLAAMAAAIDAGWHDGFADTVLSGGAEGNTRFLSSQEARQAVYTLLVTGIEFTKDQRLGRPLGSFERPRPERAEARLSGRSLRDVRLSLAALEQLALTLHSDAPQTIAAFARARALAEGLNDPDFAAVTTPGGRLKVEILQQAVTAVRDAVTAEIAPALNVALGFNAADGD